MKGYIMQTDYFKIWINMAVNKNNPSTNPLLTLTSTDEKISADGSLCGISLHYELTWWSKKKNQITNPCEVKMLDFLPKTSEM